MNEDRVILLERLLKTVRELGAAADVEEYLKSILSAAVELTGIESAFLLQYDESLKALVFKSVPWFHRESLGATTVPLEGSAAGWVFQNGRTLVIDDTSKDGGHDRKIDERTIFTAHSILAAPLTAYGKPFGVFEAINKQGGYTEQDVFVVETLAALAAAAMQTELLERSILSSQEEARELDRLKNEFIAITSHELRTPLGLILGYATFLKELTGNQYHEQVDAIIRNATRLKEILESLTSVNNYEKGSALIRSRRASVARIIEDVCASFRDMAAAKGITLAVETDPHDSLWVEMDGSKIAIVLSNLIKNAITFTEEGGHVTVRAGQQTGFVKVSVKDDGLGIPAKDLPRIFDRFYQVESHLTRKHGGMGLGLSVAKVMIEMHGGRIWAESVEGAGSTFTFLLPINGRRERRGEEETFVN